MRRYRVGDYVPLIVQCSNTTGSPAAPTAAPLLTIYNQSGTAVVTAAKMPPMDKPTQTGAFKIEQRVTSAFSTGFYDAYIDWAVAGNTQNHTEKFQVVAGGDASGAYLGTFWYPRPDSNWIVAKQEDGQYERRRNPS